MPARGQRPDRDALACAQVRRAARSDGLDHAGELVPLDARVRIGPDRVPEVSEEVVEVGAAEADRLRADEHLAVLRLARVRYVGDPHRPGGLGDRRLHPDSSPTVSDSRRR